MFKVFAGEINYRVGGHFFKPIEFYSPFDFNNKDRFFVEKIIKMMNKDKDSWVERIKYYGSMNIKFFKLPKFKNILSFMEFIEIEENEKIFREMIEKHQSALDFFQDYCHDDSTFDDFIMGNFAHNATLFVDKEGKLSLILRECDNCKNFMIVDGKKYPKKFLRYNGDIFVDFK